MSLVPVFKPVVTVLINPRTDNASPAGVILCTSVTPIRLAVNVAFVDHVRFSAQRTLSNKYRMFSVKDLSSDKSILLFIFIQNLKFIKVLENLNIPHRDIKGDVDEHLEGILNEIF